jgi:hypothetical protein
MFIKTSLPKKESKNYRIMNIDNKKNNREEIEIGQ